MRMILARQNDSTNTKACYNPSRCRAGKSRPLPIDGEVPETDLGPVNRGDVNAGSKYPVEVAGSIGTMSLRAAVPYKSTHGAWSMEFLQIL